MNSYRLTPAARHDLASIWDYTERKRDPQHAEAYLRSIQLAVESIAEHPKRGRPRHELRDGLRSFPAARRIIYYIVANTHVDIIRILHHRMDTSRRT
ncbi:MAG: type II toxin-antitoxin system RelE/ParE family toxin [Corynebacterium sp.]|uniref:type II toxin-antitoxin system RelE/ParE family toxin n=1 Tax=Corynebacterium sp. TaxID=1720 RepID=UPI0026DFCC7F|nr:type II toxin-antitoxin system RelE/ParE family toxin [Corynebacterium sp.]MDO5670378.1 type II toxin-antitoxin system RelE/ParE family toxin [Corynebacterium sp.]